MSDACFQLTSRLFSNTKNGNLSKKYLELVVQMKQEPGWEAKVEEHMELESEEIQCRNQHLIKILNPSLILSQDLDKIQEANFMGNQSSGEQL